MRFTSLLRQFVRRASYVQGQSVSPRTREYFYYIDHQGQVSFCALHEKKFCNFTFLDNFQLFLDDVRVKNFITCFKGKRYTSFLLI